jgi:hypothetical protein
MALTRPQFRLSTLLTLAALVLIAVLASYQPWRRSFVELKAAYNEECQELFELEMEEAKLRRNYDMARPFIINDIEAVRYWDEVGEKLMRRIEAQERRVRRAEAAMNAAMPPK